jgi:hypothetical protein
MLPRLLNTENEHAWADSAYSGECFHRLLDIACFERLICEKGALIHPLRDAGKELNCVNQPLQKA